jgi:DNA end-binding protein Ku
LATRPVWNGVITFGMVTIPVGLHTATEEKEIHFNQLHKGCGARVKYQKICPVHEKVLQPAEIERGYEISKGRFVVVEEEDLSSLPIPSKHTIEVSAFVKVEEIDPLYFDRPYYVEPSDIGKKPLALLIKALVEKGVAALGKVALRNRETLCLLRVSGEGLVLELLHWPDEIRVPVGKVASDIDVDAKQLKMAESLIDLLADKFDPAQYHDEFREALKDKIEAKATGSAVIEQAPEAEATKVIDLMEALRASVEAAKAGRKSG